MAQTLAKEKTAADPGGPGSRLFDPFGSLVSGLWGKAERQRRLGGGCRLLAQGIWLAQRRVLSPSRQGNIVLG